MKNKFFVLIALILITSNRTHSQPEIRSIDFRKSSVIWVDQHAFVVNHKSKEVKQLYVDVDNNYYVTETGDYSIEEVETLISNGADASYWEKQDKFTQKTLNTMLSVVGPYVSYQTDYYFEGGAHPSYGTFFETYNIESDTSIALQDLFNEEDLLKALLKDTFIQKYLMSDVKPDSIESLFEHFEGDCDYDFSLDNLTRFSFHHIKDDKVAVRIGISYGCEVMRGNFAQIGIYLPITKKLKKLLKKASKKKTLMKDLSPY